MESTSAWKFLNALWSGIDLNGMVCCECHAKIEATDVLARTFTMRSLRKTKPAKCTEEIEIPAMNDAFLIYCRHLHCLLESTTYVTISHVWQPEIAKLQDSKAAANDIVASAAAVAQEEPALICRSLANELSEPFEVWHDYISVPQWTPELKGLIIRMIPDLFRQALMTLVYLADVDASHFVTMREGQTIEARCRSISAICGARWFSRAWTTMELTESTHVRVMTKGYNIVENDSSNTPFLSELKLAWDKEVEREGFGRNLELIVGILAGNLVPWQLGPVMSIRDQRLKGHSTPFAEAYDALSRRGVTQKQDFFHAMQGMLNTYASKPWHKDPRQLMAELAKLRLLEGDLSPLLMTPASAQTAVAVFAHGYLELKTFALGTQAFGPEHPEVIFNAKTNNPIVQVEEVGTVSFVRCYSWAELGPARALSELCRLTLDHTGVNARTFSDTLCVRLYGQDAKMVRERLAEGNRYDQLRERLLHLCDLQRQHYEQTVHWIADATGLSNLSLRPSERVSPMTYLVHHGGSIHQGESCAVIGVRCSTCTVVFLLRIALYKPGSTLVGLKVYRIPGLQYAYTQRGGAGFVLHDGRVVGRIVWGTPTCDCSKLTEVEVEVNDLPLPKPYADENSHKHC